MFKVVFKKHVHSCFAGMSSNDIYLHREIEMPFVPQIGMEVSFDDFNATVESLCWAKGVLWAFTEPDKELYNHQLHKHVGKPRSIEEVAAEWVESGWQISDGVLSV